MSVPSVDLRDQPSPIRQPHSDSRPYGRRAVPLKKPQTEKSADVRRFVPEKIRGLPLVGAHKIQPAIAVNVGNCNASADHRVSQTQNRSNVMIATITAADEERVPVVSAQIRARSKVRPETRIVDDLVVARAQRLQFGPAIDCSPDKPTGLDRFKHAVIVEISQPRVPAETAA